MAWETVDLLSLITSDFNGSDYVMENPDGYRNPGTGYLNDNITPIQIETSFWDSYEANDYIIGNSNAGIRFNDTGSSGISLMLSGTAIVSISLETGWGLKPFVLVAGINRETERGSIFMLNRYYDFPEGASSYPDTYKNSTQGDYLNDNDVYQALTGIIGSSYNWESVPSISGKNGVLSLATLKEESVNDGEPVSGASISVFDQAPSDDNNVKDLADTYGSGEESSAVDVTVKYKVTLPPGGIFDVLKLVAKKGSEPEDVTDGDKIVNISANKTKKTVTGLDENSMYYFKIFAEDSNGSTSESNEKHIMTSGDEGYEFDYTGLIQTFVAPKTGIYQLETWGAQGGDATDGTNTARGGYGAYAVGEVLLTQGETIYINVGGQDGYGGGGGYALDLDDYLRNLDYSNYVYLSGGQNNVTPFSGYEPNIQQYYGTDKILVVGKSENLRPVWDSENNCIRTNGTGGTYDYVFIAIPLPHRIYGVSKYKATTKINQGSNVWAYIDIGCIVNNSMMQTKAGGGISTNDWGESELDGDSGITSDAGYTYYHLEDMPYVDYLIIEVQGMAYWKDNKLYFE